MLLRPRQELFVKRSLQSLLKSKNTLAVSPTGSGKTIMLSAVVGRHLRQTDGGKAIILAHRDEITAQNLTKFKRVNPEINASVFDADKKDWSGDVVFAMIQTLSRANNLDSMPPCSLLVCDESHHILADSYMRVVRRAREINNDCLIYGVTATPNRGDRRGLRAVFDNMADQISVKELIDAGHLVPPRPFVIDVGAQDELKHVRKTLNDFDMAQVAQIMNKSIINEQIVTAWKEKASGRKTIVFCSTVAHSEDVCATFNAAGINAEHIDGETPDGQREEAFRRLALGSLQVLCNVAIAVEGTDIPPVSCIVLLRPCSYLSTMIQMIGRGLRTVNPEEFPGIEKTDCVILDFGTSILTHGSIEQQTDLEGKAEIEEGEDQEAPSKMCPECDAKVPLAVKQCPFCLHSFETKKAAKTIANLKMSEIDLFKKSNFKWIAIDESDNHLMACGFNAWAGTFLHKEKHYAFGGGQKTGVKFLGIAQERIGAIALGEDHMNTLEEGSSAHKSRAWLREPASEKQNAIMVKCAVPRPEGQLTKYRASCLLSLHFNKKTINRLANAIIYR